MPEIVKGMQTDDLGGFFIKNLGYGKKRRLNWQSVADYLRPTYRRIGGNVSTAVGLHPWTKWGYLVYKMFNSLTDAAYAARAALGYSGKP